MILKIFNIYIPLRKFTFFLLESLFIWGGVILAAYLRFRGNISRINDYDLIILKSLVIVIVVQVSFYYFDLYAKINFRKAKVLFISLFQALTASTLILTSLYYFLPQLMMGRGIFFISILIMLGPFFVWRLVYVYLIKKKHLDQKTLIIGTGDLATTIAKKILADQDNGFSVIGFISDDPAMVGFPLVNPSVIGDYSMLSDLVQRERPDRIIVALDERRGKFPLSQLLDLKLRGIHIEDGINFFEHLAGKLHVESLNPSNIIFSEGFKKSQLTIWVKRIIEISLSFAGLVLLAPLLFIISILIKLESPGPVFYSQERVGRNSKIFKLFKFRSMFKDAEKNGPVWASENDNRITRVGRWLRMARLDELPQLINVLKGDMSFIGPRPERPFFVEQLRKEIPYYDQRHTVRPGLTGWAQIRHSYGATKEAALEKLKYDLYYIKNLSTIFDLYIMLETVKVVLSAKGAR